MWSQFFSDLGRDTNTEFSMRVGEPNKSRQDFENSTTSFLITNPKATSTVLERPNAIHVAFINPQWSLVNGGVITAKSDSGYTALDDLKGKKYYHSVNPLRRPIFYRLLTSNKLA